MNVYFDKEEAAFILDQPKGWLRRLVRQQMGEGPTPVAFPSQPSKTPAYVPEEPPKDVFGPRLK